MVAALFHVFCLHFPGHRQSKTRNRKVILAPSSDVDIKLCGVASFNDSSRKMRCPGRTPVAKYNAAWILDQSESRLVGLNRSAIGVVLWVVAC